MNKQELCGRLQSREYFIGSSQSAGSSDREELNNHAEQHIKEAFLLLGQKTIARSLQLRCTLNGISFLNEAQLCYCGRMLEVIPISQKPGYAAVSNLFYVLVCPS